MRGEEGEWRGGLEDEPGEASLTSADLASSPESPLLTSAEGVKAGIKQKICGVEQLDEGGNQNSLCWGYSLAAGMGPMLWVCPLPHTVTLGVNSRSNSGAPGEKWPPLTWAGIRRGAPNEDGNEVEAGQGGHFSTEYISSQSRKRNT